MYGEWYAVRLSSACRAVEERQPGQKSDAVAAGRLQLLFCPLVRVRFADNFRVQYCNLVGADNQVIRILLGKRSGLLLGESGYELLGAFSG